MIAYLIKSFGIIFCSFYTSARLINRAPHMKKIIFWLPVVLLVSIASYFAKLYIAPFNAVIISVAVFLSLIISYKKSINISVVLSILSLGMGLISYFVSSFVCIPISFIFFNLISNITILDIISAFVYSLVQFICTFLFFKLKRFKNGIISIEKVFDNDVGLIVSLFALFLFFIFYTADYHLSLDIVLFFILLICGVSLYLWWKKHIKNIYKDKINKRNAEILENTLSENIELKNQLEAISKLVHRDNKLIPAMKSALEQILTFESIEEQKKKSAEMLEQLKELSEDRKSVLEQYEQVNIKLPETGIVSIDASIRYLFSKAKEVGTTFDVVLSADLNSIIKEKISEKDLNTVILDLGENAIIAAKASNSRYILFATEMQNETLSVNIYDSGEYFQPNVLLNMGLKRVTTHKKTGGSGIGLMTTFELLKNCQASFITNETIRNDNYRKSISVCFDGLSQFRIYTNRTDIIKMLGKRSDIIIN